MKKKMLSIFTILLFSGALLFSLSSSHDGHISLIGKVKAFSDDRRPYTAVCPNGIGLIIVCGVGSSTCTPIGECGPIG